MAGAAPPVGEGIEAILHAQGRIDVLINNGGYALAGAIEETTIEEALALFQTNLLGALRTCRAVLPSMRARGVGLILNVSSLAGRIRLPFQGIYSAARFALEGVSEALRLELRPFGVRIGLVGPGDIRTRSEGEGRSERRRPTSAPDRIPRSSPTSWIGSSTPALLGRDTPLDRPSSGWPAI